MNFEELLRRAGIGKAELARRLGLNQSTVYSWKGDQPTYATAYLELLVAYNRVRP